MTNSENKQLPDFSTVEKVYVFGTGPSLREYKPDDFTDFPTVGCNSAIEFMKLTVWCSAHANFGEAQIPKWLNSGNYEHAFFMRWFVSENSPRHKKDLTGDAEQVLRSEIFNNINWIDGGNSNPDVFARAPYYYGLTFTSPARYSSGLLSADVALRLGAKRIEVVGFDYRIDDGRLHWKDAAGAIEQQKYQPWYYQTDYLRLKNLHIRYFSQYPIPVIYRGADEDLKTLHGKAK